MKLAQIINKTGEQEAVIQTLCHLMNVDRTTLFLSNDIDDNIVKDALKIIDKYKKGIPLAYLLGFAYFYNRKFFVNENVLVPRFDTEILVECAERKIIADMMRPRDEKYKILDLCCGSGIVGISVAHLCDWLSKRDKIDDGFRITLSDKSIDALMVAKKNINIHNIDADLVHSDLIDEIDEKFNLILCNPPYIRTKDIGVEDKRILKEPIMALDGGVDGLYFYRRILSNINKVLAPGGTIMFEIGYDQAEDLYNIATSNGFSKINVYKDLANNDRVVTIRV